MNDSRSSLNKFRVFFVCGLGCIVLMGLVWSLDPFFIYLMLGAACYCFFQAYRHKPAAKPESKKKYTNHSRKPSTPTKTKIQPVAYITIAFIGLGIFLVMAIVFIFNATVNVRYDADVAYDQAYNFQINEQYDSAKFWYQVVLDIDPDHQNAMIGLGNVFLSYQKYDSAWYYYDLATITNPSNDDARYNKAITRYYQGRYVESFNEAKDVLERNPDYLDAAVLIGDSYNAREMLDSALHWYEHAYNAGYESSMLVHVMAYAYDTKGKTREAIDFYRKTLELDSTQVEIYLRLSELLPGPESEKFRQLAKRYELD